MNKRAINEIIIGKVQAEGYRGVITSTEGLTNNHVTNGKGFITQNNIEKRP